MALFTLTTATIKTRIETLFKRVAGRAAENIEKDLIEDAVNMALIDMCTDYGVDRIRLMKNELTVDTVADQEYVDIIDLTATKTYSILNVMAGTVRIEAERQNLRITDMETIFSSDPEKSIKDIPAYYAPTRIHGTPEGMRLYLWPIPPQVYTIDYTASIIVDDDSTADFPTFLMPALKDKATENAMRDLGFPNVAFDYAQSYENRLKDIESLANSDAPLMIGRRGGIYYPRIQRRAG